MAPRVTWCAGDGDRAAKHLLSWSSDTRGVDTDALRAGMRALFAERCQISAPGGVEINAVLRAVLQLARKHAVRFVTLHLLSTDVSCRPAIACQADASCP
jgi:predicted unusual protein kinase regulating ubiquinone biosynthesis (AarF/ABC1/UbiB family)